MEVTIWQLLVRIAIAHPKKEEFRDPIFSNARLAQGGIHAPFLLHCTSEVTKWFLYINITLLHNNNEFEVKGESEGLDFCHFPARKVVWGVEMQVLVRISPFFCLKIGLGSNHTH